jgi:hypothetical protein
MPSNQQWTWIGVSAAILVVVANAQWRTITRETQLDGAVQREYLVLGRYKYTATVEDAKIRTTPLVAQKFEEYGLERFSTGESGMITIDKPRVHFDLNREAQGDIKLESAKLTKEMPWLKQAWHGSRFTHFYARGTHPKRGGLVEVSCGRLPERKHGPGQLRFTVSITE